MRRTDSEKRREWYGWLGLTVASFAVLESQGIRRVNGRRTLSHHVKGVCQTNKAAQSATVIAITGVAAWLTYHFAYEQRED